MGLTKEQIETYHSDGYLSGIGVMTEEETLQYRKLFDELEAETGRERAQIGLLGRHFDIQFIWDIATHPGILDCVEALIGPNVLLLGTHFFCKYGPDEKYVAWHQDLKYWGLEPPVAVTAWYAVDDSDKDNGCMRVIPGMHHAGMLEHGTSERSGNLLSVNQEAEVSKEDEQRAVDCALKAGEMSLHDGMLLHGSLPNRSTRRRCGLTLRYIPTRVRPLETGPAGMDHAWKPIQVRGKNPERNYELTVPPFPMS